MVKPSINFMSYNSTGLDTIKTNWIRDLIETCDISFLQIQEHFKATKSVNKYFKIQFPQSDSFVIPAYRETNQDKGRAKAGLAQISRKSLDVRKEQIPTKSFRLQAQILHFGNYRLLWINAYFPTDPRTIQYDETDLLQVQTEIVDLIDNNSFDDVILGGDFNYDKTRATGFVACMTRFIEKLELTSVWDKFPIGFTHIHTDLRSTAVLDNFFVSEGLLDYIEDAGALHLGDNLSRHSPIMLKIRIGDIPTKRIPVYSKPRRPAWHKADEDCTAEYTEVLAHKLAELAPPDSLHCSDVHCDHPDHGVERDQHLLNIMCTIIETSYKCIPLTSKSKLKPDPSGNCIVQQCLPEWKENVQPLRQDALFWRSVWISSGRPNKGQLHTVMAWSRNKYHYSVRRAKNLAASMRAQELLEAAEVGDMNLLMEMKKYMGKKDISQSIPESLDGKVTQGDILDRFKTIYETLYNSAGTEAAMIRIKERLRGMVGDDSLAEVDKITGQVLKEACIRMKPGKNDVSESFSSDVFLHAPDILYDQLAEVFRSFLIHGSLTLQILTCAFLPIFKGGLKNPASSDSYRAIAGGSQVLKLFEYVILVLWGDLLGSDSLQFGYRSGTSTSQCSWLVTEVAGYYLRRGTAVSACLLDCSKAFDKCRFDHIFEKVLQKSIPPIVVRVLIYMYEEQTGFVKLGGNKSNSFRITNGTRQGSVLSPAIFSVYLDDLLKELREKGLGCHIGGWWFGACGFADDLILLAPVRSVLQEMVSVCERYGVEHNLVFSTDPNPSKSKTKCIFFCGRVNNVEYPAPVLLDGKELPWVQSAEHLGHTLHQVANMDLDCKIRRAKFINKTVELRELLSFAHPSQVLKAVQVYCSDAYGSMLCQLNSESSEKFFRSWNTCVKLVYDIPRDTFTYLVEDYFAKGFSSLRNQVISRYPSFFHKLLLSPSREVRLLAHIVSRDPESVTARNIRYVKELTSFDPWDFSSLKIKAALPIKTVPEGERWRLGLLDSLVKIRRTKLTCLEDKQRITAMLNSLCNS